MPIKAIVFDMGGIFIGVDYQKTIDDFKKLGASNPEGIYTQAEQMDFVDLFETGKIDSNQFRNHLREVMSDLPKTVSDNELDDAWNAMLLDFNPSVLQYISGLKNEGCKTFIFSNVNAIHFKGVQQKCREANADALFNNSFNHRFFSHEFGHNKPTSDSFRVLANQLLTEHNIYLDEILFIDDSPKHIHGQQGCPDTGAIAAGWRGVVVEQNLSAEKLQSTVENALQRYGCHWRSSADASTNDECSFSLPVMGL